MNNILRYMASTSDKVLQLRQLLADRFGHSSTALAEEAYPTGLPALDEVGIPVAAVTEIVSSPASSSGGMLLLYGLLHCLAQKSERVVLVDGKGSFQPKGLPQGDLQHLLWTRCHSAKEALQAADLTARDGNFPLIVLLLTLNPSSELKRVPSTAWHRLQMLVEKSGAALLAFTPVSQVGCARLRLSVGGDFPLGKLHRCRSELLPVLRLNVERRRIERRYHDEEIRRSICA
jgi:hypothetical protein